MIDASDEGFEEVKATLMPDVMRDVFGLTAEQMERMTGIFRSIYRIGRIDGGLAANRAAANAFDRIITRQEQAK